VGRFTAADRGRVNVYNIFRWYRAGWGRYTQADPIATIVPETPLKPFAYGGGNPLSSFDPFGLYTTVPNFPDSCRRKLERAADIVRRALDKCEPPCQPPPQAPRRRLRDILDDPATQIGYVAVSPQGPCAYGDTPWTYDPALGQVSYPARPRITGFACRMGRWMIARALIHELTHIAEQTAFEQFPLDRERRCGFPPLSPSALGCQ